MNNAQYTLYTGLDFLNKKILSEMVLFHCKCFKHYVVVIWVHDVACEWHIIILEIEHLKKIWIKKKKLLVYSTHYVHPNLQTYVWFFVVQVAEVEQSTFTWVGLLYLKVP